MVRKIIGYAILIGLVGALCVTGLTTISLYNIDRSLTSSLSSTRQLVAVQRAIIEKNSALGDVVSTTESMGTTLSNTLHSTQSIRNQIHLIDRLNEETLFVNQTMSRHGVKSSQQLSLIHSNLATLTSSMSSVYDTLNRLNQIISNDKSNLDRIHGDADEMNQKLPGVLTP